MKYLRWGAKSYFFTGVLGLTLSSGIQAELKVLNDGDLAVVSGQAGLTIDVDVEVSIAEIAYRDAGFASLEDLAIGGADRAGGTGISGRLDNLRMVMDIADGSETLAYGFSNLDLYYTAVASPDAAWNAAILANEDEQQWGDGDLVIHYTATNKFDGTRYDQGSDSDVLLSGGPTNMPSDSFQDSIDDLRNSVDIGFQLGAIKLHDSGYVIGSKSGGTTLLSNLKVEILGGPTDLVIQNNGNGFTNGVADSKILSSSYFEINDMSMDIDILGVSLSDMRIHNRRGDTTGLNTNSGLDGIAGNADDIQTQSFGFAQTKGHLAALKDSVPVTVLNVADTYSGVLVDGVQLASTFKGDFDIGNISFGNTGVSVGEVYMTDIVQDVTMNISAH